jgi:hypothetical protein
LKKQLASFDWEFNVRFASLGLCSLCVLELNNVSPFFFGRTFKTFYKFYLVENALNARSALRKFFRPCFKQQGWKLAGAKDA